MIENIFNDCLTIEQYAQQLGVSRRTLHRYIRMGMPTITGVRKCIHLPTVNDWWLLQATASPSSKETWNGKAPSKK